jgi:hypothetical protein
MAHGRVAVFTLKPGSAHEVAGRAEQDILPLFRNQPGFISYTLMTIGDDAIASFSMWDSKRQAEEANRLAGDWVQKNLSGVLMSVDGHIGDVVCSFPPALVEIPAD